MKKLIFLLACIPCLSYAGEFKKVRPGEYEFTGTMMPADALALRKLFATESDPFKITVDSPGGYLSAGIEMAEVTNLMQDRVQMVSKECFSAAAMWVSADPGYTFYDEKSLVAFHLPWVSRGGVPQEQSIGDTSSMAVAIWESMRKTLSQFQAPVLFDSMCAVRDRHGINGFVVFRKGQPMTTGLWKPDGWKWDDGTDGKATRLDPFYVRP